MTERKVDLDKIREGYVLSRVLESEVYLTYNDKTKENAENHFDQTMQRVRSEVFEEVKNLILQGGHPVLVSG